LFKDEEVAFRAEYITSISDYDLNMKEEVFYILNRDKFQSEVFFEKIKIPYEYQVRKELPLDSRVSWRISPCKNA